MIQHCVSTSRKESVPSTILGIDGLLYCEHVISLREEHELLEFIDQQEWNNKLHRRTQHYGCEYEYTQKTASRGAPPIPACYGPLINRLLEKGVLRTRPDQMIVNEYVPGQGIASHVDSPSAFADGIAYVSLGGGIVMDFVRGESRREVYLAPRSVVSLHGSARYEWHHGITPRKSDYRAKRERRVLLTFCNKRKEPTQKE